MSNYLQRFYPYQSLKLMFKQLSPATTAHSFTLTPSAVENRLRQVHNHTIPYTLEKRQSTIPNAGNGIYLHGNHQKKGDIICFYPGTIYLPSEPILFVSINNQYILRCVDGICIDGKSTGLSGRVYKSLYYRENWPGAIQISDLTWMYGGVLKNPLAVGQYVNNGTSAYPANVCYQEVDIPAEFPHMLRGYIPNMYWDAHTNPLRSPMRMVALFALSDVYHGDELFSTYMANVS
ncbi:hypothetical protein BDB01DRAFT_775263 [Pilobolus umbonatus]|nr:hypothetical protein BDB01DRAFT_775263 [Pilobolus umbonatus]